MNQNQIAFARLTKIDIAKRLVYARAVQEVPDRVGEIMDYETSKPEFEKWSASQFGASLGKSAGNVRAMHKDIAAGIVVPNGITFHDDERAIDVCIHVTDDAEWAKCESGTYTGISVGGRYVKKWEDTELKKVRYTAGPSELSLVDRPAIPTSTFFTVQKADGTTEERPFVEAEVALHAGDKDLGIMVKSSVLPQPGKEFEHAGQTYLLGKVEDGRAEVEIIYSVAGTPEDLGAFAKALNDSFAGDIKAATAMLLKAAPPKSEPLDDAEVFAAAAQLAADSTDKVTLDAFKKLDDAGREPWLVQARDALQKKVAARADTSAKEGEHKYGSATFADETNKKYPIDTDAHVRAALSYWGMAKNRAKYSADDQKTIGGKIHAAAKKLGIGEDDAKKLDGSYESFRRDQAKKLAKVAGKDESSEAVLDEYLGSSVEAKKMDRAFLRKGLITCASFAYALNSLCQIAESVEMESAMEGDGSDLCDRIYALIAELGEALKDMVDEEVREEVDGTEKSPPPGMLAMSEALAGLKKSMASYMGSDKGKGQLQKLHDRTSSMGAMCKAIPNDGGDLKVAAANKADAVAALKKMNPALTDEGVEALLKAMPTHVTVTAAPGSTDTLQKTITDLTARLAKIEAQPAPARISMRVAPAPVSKEADGGVKTTQSDTMEKISAIVNQVEPVRNTDGSINEAATATKIMQKMGGARVMANRN